MNLGRKNDAAAVTEYNRALSLLGRRNDEIRLNTLNKAAIVWTRFDVLSNAQQAAAFLEESAQLLTEKGKADEASKEWIAAGKIYARLTDEESVEKASELFDAAVLVTQVRPRRELPETNAAIGRVVY